MRASCHGKKRNRYFKQLKRLEVARRHSHTHTQTAIHADTHTHTHTPRYCESDVHVFSQSI